jgi:basic amino acid/polyamine antiporter, APA family
VARKIPVLDRFLGAPALYAMAYGEISSSLYYALGITAVYALSLTPLVFLAAGGLFALAAAAYAEAGATIPEPGGASAYARRAFNDLVGFIAGWATVLDYVIAVALSALFVPHYLTGALLGEPNRFTGTTATLLAVAVLVVVTLVRLMRRTDIYAAGVALAVVDLTMQAGLAVLGLVFLFDWDALRRNIDLGVQPTWNSLAFSLPIAMIGFTGLEKVSSLAGMAKDPAKTVPDSVRTSVFTVIVVYAAVATAATSAFPSSPDPSAPAGYSSGLTTTWRDAPLLGLAHAIGDQLPHVLAVMMRVSVGLAACAVMLLAIATSFSGCARLADAMGQHSQLPAVFARRSRRALASSAAIVGVGVLSCMFLIVGAFFQHRNEETLTLASIFSFGILIAFMLTQASITWLRIDDPDMPRPFMMKGNVWIAGRLIPLPAVAGAAGAFAAWVVALGTHPGARDVGLIWMLVGLAMYAVVRVRQGLPLIERYEPAAPPPAEVTEGPRGPIVVPLERPGPIAEEMMATACRLAVENGVAVVGVSGIMVPIRFPIDDPRPQREAEVAEVQRMAAELAADYGVEYRSVVERTRNPGRTILNAAEQHGADLIAIGSPEKRRLARSREEAFFGRTVDFVLRKAPCRVIVTHFPAETEAAVESGVV